MAAVFAKQPFVRYAQKVDDKKAAEGRSCTIDHWREVPRRRGHEGRGRLERAGRPVLPYLRFAMGTSRRWAARCRRR